MAHRWREAFWRTARGVAWGDRVVVALLAPSALALLWFSSDSWRVELRYANGVGPRIALALGQATSYSPLGLLEWVEAGAALVALGWLGRVAWRLRHSSDRAVVIGRALGRASSALLVVGVWFYAAWGMSYARPPASERLGLETLVRPSERDPAATLSELRVLGERWVEVANHRYLLATDSYDLGEPSRHPGGLGAIDEALERGYAAVAAAYGLGDAFAWRRPPARGVLASSVMSFAGIGGIYFPFTGEANFNRHQPHWQQPFTIAHEKAHQRMIASEDEANFFGFLAAAHSGDPYVEYTAALWAQRRMLLTLQRYDRASVNELVRRRYPGIQRDVVEGRRFWDGYTGPIMDFGSSMNDAYLKLNRVPGGVDSYARATRLLILWARARDGVVWPPSVPWRVGPGAAGEPLGPPSLPWSGGVKPPPSSAPL